MGTFVVLAVLILAVGLVLRSMIRAKKPENLFSAAVTAQAAEDIAAVQS